MAETELYKLTETMCGEIDQWIAKFPPERKQSALLASLHIVQKETGWLSTAQLNAVADYLGLAYVTVYEVATFYSMYDLQPVGRHKVHLCNNISCMLNGSEKLSEHVKAKLGVEFGATTTDGKFTLKHAECLAACAGAPAAQIDGVHYENLTPEKIDKILDNLD
ncbi:MAG: NADH-quinone oxidoreductase subunit NuoE [Gammaproteobacteria bacterium]|jgi:NADH-quinone oxidoreductase subunit E|nr:NADH-quinone oxidoreductase subunit NuoE [Gammaproteobacteria bacterium]